ncbi:MAG TPA: DNA primase, partial [Candidatus Binataceae bacterium]|nr:DNA primase [Candidatus Binataceae bacterium]
FSVSAERGFFHCFGCGVGGTVFDFVMRMDGLTFPEAMQSLARRYGVALPQPAAGPGVPSANERDALVNANQVAADFYAHVLWKTPDGAAARHYLKARGITVETAQTFALGFAPARPANLAAALHKRNLVAAGVRVGLLKQDDRGAPYDMFRARLMFPIRDAQGRVIAFGGRVLDDRLPKYINSPESPLYSKARTVYGLNEARQAIAKADRAIIVEGYIDTIALAQAGFKETVASLGTSLTVDQLRLLARYTRNLIACFDGDAAGRKASMRALEVFLEAGLLGRGAFIPAGFDPDTLVRERGTAAFGEVLDAAELLVDYFLSEEAEAARGSVEVRARSAERVAQILGKVANPFEFDLLARKAAGMLAIDEELLRGEGRKLGRGQRRIVPGAPAPRRAVAINAALQAELGLLALALLWPDLRAEISSGLNSFAADETISAIIETCRSSEPRGALEATVMGRLTEDQRVRLSALMVGPLLAEEAAARPLIEDYFIALEEKQRRDQMQELRSTASSGVSNEVDATAAAQAVITLRRQGSPR